MDISVLLRKLAREKNARQEAEKLLEVKSLALYESNNQLLQANKQLKNILDNKNITLIRREQEYKSLVESINDIICKTDLDGTITYVNPIVKSLIGYNEIEVLGKKIFQFLPSSIQRKRELLFLDQIENRSCAVYTEIPIISKLNMLIWFGVNIQFYTEKCISCGNKRCKLFKDDPIKSKVGCKIKEIIIVARDISEQKNFTKLLGKQTKNLEQGIKKQVLTSEIAQELNSTDSFNSRMITVLKRVGTHTDTDRVFIFEDYNDGKNTKNTYEWCKGNIKPQIDNLKEINYDVFPSWKKIIADNGCIIADDIYELPDDLLPILKKVEIKSLVVYPLTSKNKTIGFIGFVDINGSRKWSNPDKVLLRSISGIVSAAFEREYMERSIKKERDKANTANRSKSEFLANMSHEIRTPMNAILGFSEALAITIEKPKHREMVKSIVKSGKLLLSILNDILDFSKLEAGKVKMTYAPINIKTLVIEIINIFTANASHKGIYLNYGIESNVPGYLVLDEFRLKQICFNLVGNAIKFTEVGGVNIHVDYRHNGSDKGDLIINVQDTGIGIEESQQKLIFESFRQQNGQADRKYGGTGLGLAISLKLAENMGGEIALKSEVDKGSDFILTIPNVKICNKCNDQDILVDSGINTIEDQNFQSSKLLIVDKVNDNNLIIKELLTNTAISVNTATNTKDAISYCNTNNYNLILLDLRLPDIGGEQLSIILKRLNPQSKIIAYTTSVNDNFKFSCTHTFDDYLLKPINNNDLLLLLIKYLATTPKEAETEEQNKNGISTGYKIDINEIIKDLETDFSPLWEKIKDYMILYEIEDFVNKLFEYAKPNNITPIITYTEQLNESLSLLDLRKIKVLLSEYPKIIEEFNKKQETDELQHP